MPELLSRPFPLALLALVLLGLLVWLPRRVVPARGLALLRCLLPSWRFFEQLEPLPVLEYRVAPEGQDWGAWQAVTQAPRRTPASLFANAAGNLHFACQSLIEHLVVELDDAADAPLMAERGRGEPGTNLGHEELVSYRLVCAWIELQLGTAGQASSALRYQFRLSARDAAREPLFVSGAHGVA